MPKRKKITFLKSLAVDPNNSVCMMMLIKS